MALRYGGPFPRREYDIYKQMIARCYDPKNKSYSDYGVRGITVCDRWREDFFNFFADMGKKPEGKSIDRVDNNLGYSPENCRWATRLEQNNNKSCTVKYTFNGRTQSRKTWAKELGMTDTCIRYRIDVKGWSFEKAISEPVDRSIRK